MGLDIKCTIWLAHHCPYDWLRIRFCSFFLYAFYDISWSHDLDREFDRLT